MKTIFIVVLAFHGYIYNILMSRMLLINICNAYFRKPPAFIVLAITEYVMLCCLLYVLYAVFFYFFSGNLWVKIRRVC